MHAFKLPKELYLDRIIGLSTTWSPSFSISMSWA